MVKKSGSSSISRPTTDGMIVSVVSQYKPDHFVAAFLEITEQKKAERELFAQKEHLRVTLRSIGDAVIATDVQGRVDFMNEVAERLTGWSQDRARGRPLTEVFRIVNAFTRQQCENPVEKVLREGAIVGQPNHTVLISDTGAEYQIADSAAPIRDSSGTMIGVVLVFRNVSDEYLLEAALSSSESELRKAQEEARKRPGLATGSGISRITGSYGLTRCLRFSGWTRKALQEN